MNPLADLLICGRIHGLHLHLAGSEECHAIGKANSRTVTYEREYGDKPIDRAEMTKILHTADIHLDSPLRSLAMRDEALKEKVQTATRTAFSRIVATAIEEDAAALLISGDLFDGIERSARTGAFLVSQLDLLRDAEVRVFCVKGNHDAENPVTGGIPWPDNVHVFGAAGDKVELEEGVWIHGVSFSGKRAEESLLPKFKAPEEGAVNIAMLHTSLSGAAGHDPYAPCSVADLSDMGFDYWALGHIHKAEIHSKDPWIVMPGTPQGRDIGESGPKSATLITIGDSNRIEEVREIPTSVVEFLNVEVDATGLEDDDSLRDLLRERIQETAEGLESESGAVRVTISGETNMNWRLQRDPEHWTEVVKGISEDTRCLWLDKLALDLSAASARGGRGPVEELRGLMETILDEPAFAKACRSELSAILDELPKERRDALAPDEAASDALARSLAERGVERILALMHEADDE